MDSRVNRSTLVMLLTACALCAAIPFAISRLVATGDPYLFTERFFADIASRVTGPGRLRFIIQPVSAIILGLRDGRVDGKSGRLNFIHRLFHPRERDRRVLRELIRSIGTLLAVAVLIDLTFQVLFLRRVHPLAALIVGPVLIAVPYTLSRAITGRLLKAKHNGALGNHQ